MASRIAQCFAPVPNARRVLFRGAGASERHLAPLDGLRGLALLWVIFCHAGWYAMLGLPISRYGELLAAWWMLPFWRGDFAVEVFFVMSAFLIGGMLTDEWVATGRVRLGRFYARRLLRLWPALVVAAIAELWIVGGEAKHALWPNIFYVNNLMPILSVRMGWTWSLAIEEQFYLTVPAVLAMLRRLEAAIRSRVDPVLAGLALLAVAQIVVIACIVVKTGVRLQDSEVAINRPMGDWAHGYDILYSKPWMRAGPLICGLACARLYRREGLLQRLGDTGARGTIALVVAFAIGFCCMHWPLYADAPRAVQVIYLSTYRVVFGAVVAYGMLLVLSPHPVGRALGRFLSWPVLFPLAQLAYCAYLVNPVVAMRTHALLRSVATASSAPFVWFAALDLAGTLVAAMVLSVFVERPFMELRRVLTPSGR